MTDTWLIDLFAEAAKNPGVDIAPVVTTPKKPCHRCGGSGQFPQFRHVSGGVCFSCKGKG